MLNSSSMRATLAEYGRCCQEEVPGFSMGALCPEERLANWRLNGRTVNWGQQQLNTLAASIPFVHNPRRARPIPPCPRVPMACPHIATACPRVPTACPRRPGTRYGRPKALPACLETLPSGGLRGCRRCRTRLRAPRRVGPVVADVRQREILEQRRTAKFLRRLFRRFAR